jgi:hypothetical protein
MCKDRLAFDGSVDGVFDAQGKISVICSDAKYARIWTYRKCSFLVNA